MRKPSAWWYTNEVRASVVEAKAGLALVLKLGIRGERSLASVPIVADGPVIVKLFLHRLQR